MLSLDQHEQHDHQEIFSEGSSPISSNKSLEEQHAFACECCQIDHACEEDLKQHVDQKALGVVNAENAKNQPTEEVEELYNWRCHFGNCKSERWDTLEALREHQDNRFHQRQFICLICMIQFPNKDKLHNHLRSAKAHPELRESAGILAAQNPKPTGYANATHRQITVFEEILNNRPTCTVCYDQFPNYPALKKHQKTQYHYTAEQLQLRQVHPKQYGPREPQYAVQAPTVTPFNQFTVSAPAFNLSSGLNSGAASFVPGNQPDAPYNQTFNTQPFIQAEQMLKNQSQPVFVGKPTDNQCSICLEGLSFTVARELTCCHQFHEECIKRWLVKGKNKACPNCNNPFE